MNQKVKPKSASRRFAPAGVVFAVAGALLFAYFVWRAGPVEVWNNISKIGAGFLLILVLSGLRFVVRAYAWTLCFEAPHRLGLWHAFEAYLIGDTAGNIVPLGIVVSEPAKAALVRERVPLVAGLSAIAVENLFYMLSVALFIFSGAAALLLSFPLPKLLRWSSIGILAGVVSALLVGFVAARRQWRFLSGTMERMAARGLGRRALTAKRERAAALEDRIYGFYARNRPRFLPILALEASFHLLGVAEAYLTLHFISDVLAPTLLTAFLFESVNRVITMVFKFVPLRAGVDELGTGQLARVLRFGEAAGVTLAVVRKARMLFWMAAGVALVVRRGLSLGAVTNEAERAQKEAAADRSPQDASNVAEHSHDSTRAKEQGLVKG
jgi:uncharacterized membrane protein YbhN (UPF0104 family)